MLNNLVRSRKPIFSFGLAVFFSFFILSGVVSGRGFGGGPEAAAVVQWEGAVALPDGTKLEILVKFTPPTAAAGVWTATIDIPRQGALGLPLTAVVYSSTEISFTIAQAARAVFRAVIAAEDPQKAVGELKQGGMSFPLELRKVAAGAEPTVGMVNHPQTPVAPFPYVVREVEYDNAEAEGVTLAGTLTIPAGEGPFPAVVLITGSGPQNRDEALLGHVPFAVIADYLTQNGIAVLRADDRGVAESTGDFAAATTADFVTDALAGLDFLKGVAEIDAAHRGLVGHSEGGVVAPMAAAANPAEVDFIVLLAGTGVSGREILVRQLADISRANGATEAFITRQTELQTRLLDLVITDADQPALAEAFRQLSVYQIASASAVDTEALSAEVQAQIEPLVVAGLAQLQSPWFKYFLELDPAEALRKVQCEVLAVNGALDLQVAADQNIPAIEAALRAGGNEGVTTKVFPQLNHLFQTCETGSPSEYANIEETFSPVVLEYVTDWILVVVGAGH